MLFDSILPGEIHIVSGSLINHVVLSEIMIDAAKMKNGVSAVIDGHYRRSDAYTPDLDHF